MGKLKSDRKRACSQKSIDRVALIIQENWDEIWGIVQQRARTEIYQKKLYSTRVPIVKYSVSSGYSSTDNGV
jgi:hypothetical protein